MSLSAPNLKDVVCVLPPQLVLLGEALAPVARSARQAMTRRVRSSGRAFDTLADSSRHLGVIQRALTNLSPRIDSLMTDVIHKKGVGAVETGRAAGRLEQVLSELVDGYLDAKASHASTEASEVRSLILGVYRHHIRNICNWLDNLVATISNPAVVLRRRGIEPSGDVVLNVSLNMTSPPGMVKLGVLVTMLRPALEERVESPIAPQHARDNGPGVLGTIGALAFGLGLSEAVLGRKNG